MEASIPFKVVQRRGSVATILINSLGVMVTNLYLGVIDPLPTGQEPLQAVDPISIGLSGAFLLITLIIGTASARKRDARIAEWYARVRNGTPTTNVPPNVRRDVLNTAGRTAMWAALMWGLAGVLSSILSQSFRVFVGVSAIGGLLTTAMTYFVLDVLWRPVIPLFFPQGNLSEVRAFRLPVLGRLLVVFLLVGIYPPVILAILTWQRAQALIVAANPQVVLDNLFFLQVFILAASAVASVGLAVFMGRGIVGPLDTLEEAMERVEKNDLDVQVSVTSNDELGYLGERFNHMTAGLRQTEMLRNLFNLYVSPEVAREALEHGARLGGRQVECTVLFSDIRGFTTISEQLDPQVLMDLLNRYMVVMVEVIVENGGLVNKFGGDSLLAVFGTPLNPAEDHAACALRAAQGMLVALATFNEAQKTLHSPTLKIGIGIATGPVIAGNIGGRERIEYTVIGDTVNLASRLQDKTKELDTDILFNHQTFQHASQHMLLQASHLAPLSVKGKREPLAVYALEA